MEERILEAIEYITISLDDIKDFQDFIKYKPELMKAINDIKNIIQNKTQLNKNETIENAEAEKSKISSILGLQFDYDPLINEDDAKFFSEYDENNIYGNKTKNKIVLKKINHENKKSLYNPDTILNCTESLRNKNIFLNKTKYENSKINDFKKNLKRNKRIKKAENAQNKIRKYLDENNQKQKVDLIADIIMKINSKDYLYKILSKLFGDDLSDKLLSNQISDELLDSVQNAIFEIEKINEKYKKINNINEKIEKLYQEKQGIMKSPIKNEININYKYGDEQNEFFYRPKMHGANIKNNFKYSEPYQEFNFKKSLRNQTPKTYYRIQKRDNSLNQSRIYSKNKRANSRTLDTQNTRKSIKKPFISATCNYGKYFDEPLQNGGESKLN